MVSVPAMAPGASSSSSSFKATSPVNGTPGASTAPPTGRMMGRTSAAPAPSHTVNGSAVKPLSSMKAARLDMASVERRGQPGMANEQPKRRRLFDLEEAPTFRPTMDEFKHPLDYIRSIADEGKRYGIVKIIPPDEWNPDFAIDTELFHFRTRRQELNIVEGGTRANLNYLDQLAKFHKQQNGANLNRFPSVDKRPLDLFKLKNLVEAQGGFERVCKGKKWAEVGRLLGYSGKIMSSLSTSLKNSYQKWLLPFEEYLAHVKPGVRQQQEYENGGPYTPSPSRSSLKIHQHTPSSLNGESPAVRASNALHYSINESPAQEASLLAEQPQVVSAPAPPPEPPRPSSGFTAVNSGFTAVNSGFTAVNSGFTAVNAPQPTSGFSAINVPNGTTKTESNHGTPQRSFESPTPSAHNTPNLGPSIMRNSPGPSTHVFNALKRPAEAASENDMNGDSEAGRRSKRVKKDGAPNIAGSHMTQPRLAIPRPFPARDRATDVPGTRCENCGNPGDSSTLALCDGCDYGYHPQCLEPQLRLIPSSDWFCPRCLVGTGEFGFEEGGTYSLRQFQQRAQGFKECHFLSKMQYFPLNSKRAVSEDEVEREFWRLTESLTETVEVEYGADIHSHISGSGFPTLEKNPTDRYSSDPWNLNNLPLDKDSLFRHIETDISGMTVPWLYVGMCFSCFCWHAEDHGTYSANYQHFGATKTWYGVPAEDAEKLEAAMRDAVPDLFEANPDLLFQLTTLLTPDRLMKAGVRVYALDQRAGQFVITFPQAYHAGFNHGFNFNEAVNFAPSDWEPFGEDSVRKLRSFRRQPVFCHDELLLSAATRDHSIKTARWLGPALERMLQEETRIRTEYNSSHKAIREHSCPLDHSPSAEPGCDLAVQAYPEDVSEDDMVCSYCKAFCHLSRYICKKSGKVMCLEHAAGYECCEMPSNERFLGTGGQHVVQFRFDSTELRNIVQKVVDVARAPENWSEKLEKLLDEGPNPPLKLLRSLLADGEKINSQWEMPELSDLRKFVDRCVEWVEEATNYTTRKQQNRRKNERAWRKANVFKAAEQEERDKELRNMANIQRLLRAADDIGFECPEILTLREKERSIADFRQKAREVINSPGSKTLTELEDLAEVGRGFNVDIPEVDVLEKSIKQRQWLEQGMERQKPGKIGTLQDVTDFIQQGLDLGVLETDHLIIYFKEKKSLGEFWENKAKEIMDAENVHYQQLEALSTQASEMPVSRETLSRVESILKKQREVQERITRLYQGSKLPELRLRPTYKEVKEAMEALNDLTGRPVGALDLEREQKRHEDWMRRGKKLFGKANAPLHILLQHMQYVEARNDACFDLTDTPRMPVEPSSREPTPNPDNHEISTTSTRDVFCICRRPEAGMMIECELCHEWYHGKCLKIARGKIKEDDKYTCPICDYRVKIPRDAARPKLEDLQGWQDELATLPFQPDEEACLNNIVNAAVNYRNSVAHILQNPLISTSDELQQQRFHLRKIEGADVLLVNETNFLRAELHKWAPVAPEPPPPIDVSLSTRKPRPTKQQKMMREMGIENPEDLPPHMRPKKNYARKGSEGVAGANANADGAGAQFNGPPLPNASAPHAHHTPGGGSHTPSVDPRPAGALGSRSIGSNRRASNASPLFAPHGASAWSHDDNNMFSTANVQARNGYGTGASHEADAEDVADPSLDPSLDPALFEPTAGHRRGGSGYGGLDGEGDLFMQSIASEALGLSGVEEALDEFLT